MLSCVVLRLSLENGPDRRPSAPAWSQHCPRGGPSVSKITPRLGETHVVRGNARLAWARCTFGPSGAQGGSQPKAQMLQKTFEKDGFDGNGCARRLGKTAFWHKIIDVPEKNESALRLCNMHFRLPGASNSHQNCQN